MKIFLTILLFFAAQLSGAKTQTNILLIMADDLGAENLACYGNTVYTTPQLDRMAAEGARFENAFATPVCTPTRAMILTGLYPNRTGFLERLDSPLDPEKNNRLPVHLKTFGQVFKDAGYATAIAGKWHLGDFQKYPDQPVSHGFDEYCLWVQYWDGERPSRYYAPHYWENGKYVVHGKEVFGPDYNTNFLIDFIERNRDRPFLAYFTMYLVHSPLVEPPTLKELAETHYPKDLGKNERIAGHMVTYMDSLVGRLMDKLRELDLEKNTLVIFTGDNGTATNLTNQLGEFQLRGGKRTMNEAGTRIPFIARWPGVIPPGKRNAFLSLMDMLPTLASMAGITLKHEVDGMDLSHNLLGQPGKDRDFFYMAFEGDCYFVRNDRFRLHEDGRFYEVPVTANETRYSMEVLEDATRHAHSLTYLQEKLDEFMQIKQTDTSYTIIPFGTGGDSFKNAQEKKER
ncbi:MAG: sulfatase-like hydrolase/transferase [Verrucomicrobiae bacterium]|nr:sulfatase-like hydrolase/transferase [Verrucomicrobiae bacterium]